MTQTPSPNDRDVLRRLASEIMEIGSLPVQAEKAELWRRLNDREPVRPVVLIDEEPWGELFQECEELKPHCEDPFLKGIERQLQVCLYRRNHYPVDMVIRPEVECPMAASSTGIGITQKGQTVAHDAVTAQHFDAQITGMDDIEKIQMPAVSHNDGETERG